MNAPAIFIDIGPDLLLLRRGAAFVEIPLERQENGQLTAAARERVLSALREHAGLLSRPSAWCALGARGVSLRRVTLPAAPKEKLPDLVRLQIETEFPVPPEELAWGWQIVSHPASPPGSHIELLVAAVRRKAVDEWTPLFAEAGIAPLFTPGALARFAAFGAPSPACAVLDVGRATSECLIVDNGAPSSLRALAWGGDNLPQAAWPPSNGHKVFLTGAEAILPAAAARLAALRGDSQLCQLLETASKAGRSPTLFALQRLADANRPPLLLEAGESPTATGLSPRQWSRRLAAPVALAVLVLFFPYLEALVTGPHLARRLKQIQSEEGRLDTIDKESAFLGFYKSSQPPCLDLIFLLSRSAPPGTSFESISLTRNGAVSLRGRLANWQQVTDFRTNLIGSGWFSALAVDEQTPMQGKVSIRMSGQLKPVAERKVLSPPGPNEHPAPSPNAFPMPGPMPMMPGEMPPGAPPSMNAPPARNAAPAAARARRAGAGSEVPGGIVVPTSPIQFQPDSP